MCSMGSGQGTQIGRNKNRGTTNIKIGNGSVPYSFPFPVLKDRAVEKHLFLVGNQTVWPGGMLLFVLLPIPPGVPVPQGLPFQRKGLANAPDQHRWGRRHVHAGRSA